jgi:N-acetylneuraminic acid mutarotase
MLVWGPLTTEAFNPVTNRWRRFPSAPTAFHHPGAVAVWTGHELIGWGGGCCGDAFSDGAAFNPVTNTWRKLARSPLAGGQAPTGVWTGRELIVFGVRNPDGPALRSAAAYNPATNAWRGIAPLPAPRYDANAVWDGREVLVVGGNAPGATRRPTVGFAYDPAANRWRRLRAMPSGRTGATAVWDGKRLLVWGGDRGSSKSPVVATRGLAYDPTADRWSPLPQAPVQGRSDPTAVWTGSAMIVWGGEIQRTPKPGTAITSASDTTKLFADGAVFRP